MVVGIGVDMVCLSEFRRLCGNFGYVPARKPRNNGEEPASETIGEANAFVTKTFSDAERAQALERGDSVEYLAGRFAVKEATFKALGHQAHGVFDLRAIESLDDEDGAPYVVASKGIAPVLARAGASEVLVSISNEGDYVVAFALAQ